MSVRGRARYMPLNGTSPTPDRVPYSPMHSPRPKPRQSVEVEESDPDVKRYKRFRLFWLVMSSAAWSANVCIDGPTVPDIRERLDLKMEQFARSSAIGSAGWIVGALAGGMLCDRWPRYVNLMVGSALTGIGVCLLLRPWSASLMVLCILSSISGVCGGFLNTGTSAIHFGLFGAEILPMFIRGLGWTVTCPIIPLVAKNFLSETHGANITGTNMTTSYSTTNASNFAPWWSYGDNSRIEVPYAMCAVFVLSNVPSYCYYHMRHPPQKFRPKHKEKTSWREVFSPGSCAGGSSCFSLSITICLILYFVIYDAANNARWNLAFSYAVDEKSDLHMSKDAASYLSSAGSLAHLVSRLVCIAITPWVGISTLMFVCIPAQLVASGTYVFLGLKHEAWLWASTIAIDLFQQPLWLGGYLWTERYVHVYAIMVGLSDVGVGLAGMTASWVYGHMYDVHPTLPFYVAFGFCCLFVLHFGIMQMIATCHTRRENAHKDGAMMGGGEDTQALLSTEEEEEDQVELEIVAGRVKYLRESGVVASSAGEDSPSGDH